MWAHNSAIALIVAFVIVAALTMNEQFVRRFLHKRPQLVKNQKGLLAQMAVVQ